MRLIYAAAFIPEILLLLAAAVTPAYVLPFLSNPIGIVFLVLMVAWTASGVLYFVKPETPLIAKLVWAPLCVVLVLVPLLGPAVVTIVKALGPVTTGQ